MTGNREKCIFCWSGGKDSALALYKILREDQYEVVALLTTLHEDFKRISMHGVREELLDRQAASIGLPLVKMYVSEGTNSEYEKKMESLLLAYKAEGVNTVVFGDIFLEDLRKYRENNLKKVGMKAFFPLWKQDTLKLVNEFLDLSFRTITCCVNDAYLGPEMVGVEIDQVFLKQLPAHADPCGENGEYHTFCFDGPLFSSPVSFSTGEKVYKPLEINMQETDSSRPVTKGFWFCDLL